MRKKKYRCDLHDRYFCIHQFAVLENKIPLYLFSAVYRMRPSTPQEITSPMPTVSIMNGIGSGTM